MKGFNLFGKLSILLLIITLSTACSKSDISQQAGPEKPKKVNLFGKVEKGPFVRGSILTVAELNDNFSPTGRSFKTELLDDKGSFYLSDIELNTKYIQLSTTGYYFNEVTGELSKSIISLNAIAEVSSDRTINVNILTHLEEKRVKKLLKNGNSIAEAKKQAQQELYKAFFIKESLDAAEAENISFTQNNFSSTVLLGISATMLTAANNDNAKLTELLSTISTDLEDDGILQNPIITQIKQAITSSDFTAINSNLIKRYKDLDIEIEPFDFAAIYNTAAGLKPITKIELSENKNPFILFVGSSTKISAVIYPSDAFNKSLIWESSDPSILNVDQDGNISGLKKGSTQLIVKSKENPKVASKLNILVIESPNDLISTIFVEKKPTAVNGVYTGPFKINIGISAFVKDMTNIKISLYDGDNFLKGNPINFPNTTNGDNFNIQLIFNEKFGPIYKPYMVIQYDYKGKSYSYKFEFDQLELGNSSGNPGTGEELPIRA